jgi:hypothetical protein
MRMEKWSEKITAVYGSRKWVTLIILTDKEKDYQVSCSCRLLILAEKESTFGTKEIERFKQEREKQRNLKSAARM